MIFKLTLETEQPEFLFGFLRAYGYLRTGYPINTAGVTDDKVFAELYPKDRRYRHLIKEDTKDLSEEDRKWLCQVVREAFIDYIDILNNKDYLLSQFSVEIVESCTGKWGNGKEFYVFPTTYSTQPVLQF